MRCLPNRSCTSSTPNYQDATLPIIPGHEIVGRVERLAIGVTTFAPGDRVGIPWLGWSCGECEFCRAGTGGSLSGRSLHWLSHQRRVTPSTPLPTPASVSYCLPRPTTTTQRPFFALVSLDTVRIEWPVLARASGIYGFGAAAHVMAENHRPPGRNVYTFVSPGDDQAFALRARGRVQRGPGRQMSRRRYRSTARLIFAPVGAPRARGVCHGPCQGVCVVCAGIHMSDIPSLPLSTVVGRASHWIGGKPDAHGRKGVSDACRGLPIAHARSGLCPRRCESGVGRFAHRPSIRRGAALVT